MFPSQLLLWKWVKDIYAVIIATVANRKRRFLKNGKLLMIRGEARGGGGEGGEHDQIQHFLRRLLCMFFDSRNTKNDIKTTLKSTGIKL